MGDVYVDVTEKQELAPSYKVNRSDDVLYPNTPMDARYEDSGLLNIDSASKHLGDYSKRLDVQYDISTVEHPMSS